MKSFAVYGASDDLVEQEADSKPFEETGEPRSFAFVAGRKALHVTVAFDGKRGWLITTALDDDEEEGALPFDVRIVQEKYSPKLIVDNAREPVSVMSGDRRIALIDPGGGDVSASTPGTNREHFGIRCRTSETGASWIMAKGHKVGPFETLVEAEKSARKKNRLAAERAPDLHFSAERVDVNGWGHCVERAALRTDGGTDG